MKRSVQRWLAGGVLLLVTGCGGGGGGGASDVIVPAPRITVSQKLYGLDLGPYILAGQDPNLGTVVPANQLACLMADAAQYARWVRTYGTTNGLEQAGAVAHRYGLKAAVGAYLGADPTANQQQVDNLIQAAKRGEVDLAIVGNETLLTGVLTEDQLLGYLTQVKQAIPSGIPVTTSETWDQWGKHPRVLAAVDLVLANIYPFYENSTPANAAARFEADYAALQASAGGKAIWIGETGWPRAGNPPSYAPDALPSPENQAAYFQAIVHWARAHNVALFWFEAFPEPWKASYNDYASWGILGSDYQLLPGLEEPFQNF